MSSSYLPPQRSSFCSVIGRYSICSGLKKQSFTLTVERVMTRIGRRLIEDFLLPALNDQRYGELLKWVDRDKRHFSIRWSHKNAAKWTLADTAVFQDWDKLKGHYRPEIKGYYMQAKQRFRAALYKLSSVRKLPCEDKHVKKYQLMMDGDKRREIMQIRPKIKKEENQRSIPTSVIRKNTSYIEKLPVKAVYKMEDLDLEDDLSPIPPSPTSSERSSSSDDQEEMKTVFFQYMLAQKNQRQNGYTSDDNTGNQYESCTKGDVLRESNGVSLRIPHVPIQQVPVYSGSVKSFYDSSQKRYESPRVLLVKTYNDLSEDEPPTAVKEEPIDHYETECPISNPPDIALNLSIKSDDSETLSR
ncbi:hypothetical protein JTE90_022030 [Oedothorax gibbosus]|uniref:IRF tryptophan pentad repeat domain-containing protein n=1 Tax=Oedothorax gibbosus TaxID=931172 RepID=A0AAV6V235_9ARAC|nr:hypothetical protein JTE90_022030 [Oedothorax gibbosus]